MERAPKHEVVDAEFEVVKDEWRESRMDAPAQAEKLTTGLTTAEIQELLGDLAEDNDNRFVADEVARLLKLQTLKEAITAYQATMGGLGTPRNGDHLSVEV